MKAQLGAYGDDAVIKGDFIYSFDYGVFCF